MSRVKYVPDGPAGGTGPGHTDAPEADAGVPAAQELMAQIRARRGGTLLNLDRLLLHSPPFARGWNAHLGAVRRELLLPPKLRELAICAVAVLNQVDYEWEQHSPEWLRAGATPGQLEALRAAPMELETSNVFDSVEKAVLQLTLEMTRHVRVSDPTFERVRKALSRDERVVVELVGVIASYNMVSRFLVALEIDPEKSAG